MSYRRATLSLPLFALFACPAAAGPAPAYDSGGSGITYRYLEDGERAAYHGRYTEAIAQASKAITVMPDFAVAYVYRAVFYMDSGRFQDAESDLKRVAAMHPDAREVPLIRAQIAIETRQPAAAMAALAAAAAMPTASVWHQQYLISGVWSASVFYMYSSMAQEQAGHDNAALDDLDRAMENETERPWYILSRHCYTAAVAGLLSMAELTCTEAISRNSHDLGEYDSLGLVHLKMKQWDKAIADYNQSLYYRSDLTLSVYGRGLAKRAKGDVAGGNADIAAATRDEPDIANIMTRLGAPAV
jgi:tetratricopeptide (TPR) repeat protein